jgi:hypothetical protein
MFGIKVRERKRGREKQRTKRKTKLRESINIVTTSKIGLGTDASTD